MCLYIPSVVQSYTFFNTFPLCPPPPIHSRGRRGRDRMVAGFTTTYAISAYHH